MQKILSVSVAICLLFVGLVPVADASVRVRRNTLRQNNVQYVQSYQTPSYYQNNTQVYTTSVGSTYYFSPTYVQGYTYYSVPTPGYYYYSNVPSTNYNTNTPTQQGQYYFSPTYVQGYTYYSTPNPGYYYYFNTTTVGNNYNGNYYNNPYQNNGNMICTIINGIYQCVNNTYGATYSTYPGCSSPDIIIGGQVWASCNASDRNIGSTNQSGWFFAGDRESSFVSYNGSNAALEWMGKQSREASANLGPCAKGYRLPNRGEWETLQSYARANNTSIASLINLQLNGAYQGTRNTGGDISITGRLSPIGAYWTSSVYGNIPVVMHIGSSYAGYRTNGTDFGYVNQSYNWTYTDTGLGLVQGTTGELANVRCIR